MSNDLEQNQVISVNSTTYAYLKSHPVYWFFFVLLAGASGYLSYYFNNYNILVAPIIGFFVLYTFVTTKVRATMMQQFAQSLGYTYSPSDKLSNMQGSMFTIGHSQRIMDVISGKDNDRLVRIFLYSYTVSYGKSSQTYDHTVLESTFDGNVPHILLRKSISSIDLYQPIFKDGEYLKLEGDFNKYFSLQIEKDFEVEAYQIFTPDFMEELIEIAKNLEFEFIGNKLYIYSSGFVDSRITLNTFFTLSNRLCEQLSPIVTEIKDDVKNMEELKKS